MSLACSVECVVPDHLGKRCDAEFIQDGHGQVVECRTIERDRAVAKQDSRDQTVVDRVVTAPCFIVVDKDLAGKLAERAVPRRSVAPIVPHDDVRGIVELGSVPLVTRSEYESDRSPVIAVVHHRQ